MTVKKSSFIRFFQKSFKLLIKVQIENWNREKNGYKELVNQIINTEVKANLQLQLIL